MTGLDPDQLLVARIRQGEADAWRDLIDGYEGRLLAFVASRLGDRGAAEDVVQEAFIGFLTSLPNYDARRSLESYLFSIAAHKLTDRLRREGRRPALALVAATSTSDGAEPASAERAVSSLLQSRERRTYEEAALVAALVEQIEHCRRRGQWQKLESAELTLVRGWPNKDVATALGITEQQVANHKFEFLERVRGALRRQDLPDDLFPELTA